MDERAQGEFVDLIYDAAVDPHLWEPAMARFADLIGGTSAWISQLNLLDGSGSGITSRIDPIMPKRYWAHYSQTNPLSKVQDPREYIRDWDLRILTDEDWMPKDELVRGEYYNDFMRPQDVHSVLMIRLALQEFTVASLSVNRPERRGRFETFEIDCAKSMHPHLVRAYKISQRFADAFAMDVAMSEALDRSPHGIFMLDSESRARHANSAAEAMMRARLGLQVREGRLRTPTPIGSDALRALIEGAQGADGVAAVAGSMALPVAGRRLPLAVTVTPVRAERFSVFGAGPIVMVSVTDLEEQTPVSERALQQLFGLTPAERRLAITLLNGPTLQEAADEIGVSVNTVREHLAHIFDKTGVSRQSQLVSLMLKTIGPFPFA